MLITRTINIANIGLTAPIEAVNEGENKITVYIKAVEGAYTKELNNIEKTKEQDFSRRDIISAIN
jgi:hypothetical protein